MGQRAREEAFGNTGNAEYFSWVPVTKNLVIEEQRTPKTLAYHWEIMGD